MESDNTKRKIKIVHVHFLNGRKNYYFGSVSAIFRKFSEEDIGYTAAYLRHNLCNDGNKLMNSKVMVTRSHLLR